MKESVIKKTVVGVVTNNRVEDEYQLTANGVYELEAIAKFTGAIPIMLPAVRGVISPEEALELCDGFYFPGGRENVHPDWYGHELTDRHGEMNPCRDRLSLPLIQMAVEVGKPILAVCRGHQELAVAFGSTLFAEVRDEPGRMNHRMPPDGSHDEKVALRHEITLSSGGLLETILGHGSHMVNSLHGQAVDQPGERIVIEAIAPDNTIEAISVRGAAGFALGVQWHPEFYVEEREVSKRIFEAFGDALYGRKCFANVA